ncbi:GNAT family N-acetyltransferase [bacterium M00.F.Ca.ET.228.01.1.1]|uniref:GNAT family N-acetyltransferase n=1 Tax=Paraburkholderia phenoliruptrix TaxID=252970 RepID=UPI001092EC45|nr:GNAT family N-acetyltransferase [Paraburkholderia phenoliruptrix]TGP42142.1 GNAT family N-acetyltransferase [bacterium M00.F.Ca.ET.228.01.1.1]TGR99573.1 GNAT family N-acetyltransferase [bacterium M00.F.Ca.ET.191.01.1.1]TGU03940.1 GNAT family N-acetyltransferase [bacterium M00.F.Ca.ET.155.01.1.1]MBW0448301.1 GNAT family N-acetyltransferase [Paraburkholderia phenoliruptrix]MBW9099512.1 GNAT family N-acetyltransferase [Paraburkholderia phenoliruptrix]
MSMMLTGREFARVLESTEAQHLARQVETYRKLTNQREAKVVAVSGAVAAFTTHAFGRKLNHVTGLGMDAPIDSATLVELEAAYFAQGMNIEIDVCPHADSSVLAALSVRNYHVNAFSNTYACVLSSFHPDKPVGYIQIVSDRTVIEHLFLSNSITGFSAQVSPRPYALLEALARIATARADTRLFAAKVDGEIAGTAAMSIIPTLLGPTAHLYIASTVPQYRCRGVQVALLQARLRAARDAGCVAATVTTRPGSTSARNAERAGLMLAYTKSTFVKRPED